MHFNHRNCRTLNGLTVPVYLTPVSPLTKTTFNKNAAGRVKKSVIWSFGTS